MTCPTTLTNPARAPSSTAWCGYSTTLATEPMATPPESVLDWMCSMLKRPIWSDSEDTMNVTSVQDAMAR